MTAEVCLLNRYAAVLAADSATTTSHWDDDKQEAVERYFKGANKVFQLSAHHPIGLMIYGNASLHSVPWEVLVKEFRAHLKMQAFGSPKDYADAFFAFLKSEQWLFEAGIVEQHFIYNATVAGLSILWDAEQDSSVHSAPSDVDKRLAVRAVFIRRKTQLSGITLPSIFSEADVADALANSKAAVATEIGTQLAQWPVPNDLQADELADFAIEGTFKTYQKALANHHTGIVIAGYGERQTFPSFNEYNCYGFIRGTLAVSDGESGTVCQQYPAHIHAFAQRSMVDTFRSGYSVDVLVSVFNNVESALKRYVTDIQKALSIDSIPGLRAITEQTQKDFVNGLLADSNKVHRDPLYRVIGHLPVAEMAQLAETLISLQSLKERVTKPSETVGGPIDVAVITRSEGLVWIKRKHYFDPTLNPRFFARQQVPR